MLGRGRGIYLCNYCCSYSGLLEGGLGNLRSHVNSINSLKKR